MIDHLVLFAVKGDASAGDVEDLLSSLWGLKEGVPNVVDLTVGEDFSGRGGGHTHGLFARSASPDDLRAYLEHPEHRAVVEKLNTLTTGRLVVDYDHRF